MKKKKCVWTENENENIITLDNNSRVAGMVEKA